LRYNRNPQTKNNLNDTFNSLGGITDRYEFNSAKDEEEVEVTG